jgi:aspartate beta-hydroxylase
MTQNIELQLVTYEEAIESRQSGSFSPGLERFQEYIKGLVGTNTKFHNFFYPGLQPKPWYDPHNFAFVEKLEASYTVVKEELLALRDQSGFQLEAESIKRTGLWNIYFFYERGKKNEENCSLCPKTTELIESIPSVRTLGGLIYFSAMTPGTHIHPHTGPTNLRLRCHLGLVIPEGCGISVGSESRTWEEGKCLVFNDSLVHEAWNMGVRTRFVLVVDVWHPDLTHDEIQAIEGLHRYISWQTIQLANYWRKNKKGRSEIQGYEWWL